MERNIIIVNGKPLHLILGKTRADWVANFNPEELWDFLFEEVLNGAIEHNEGIWYYYIDGRIYETNLEVVYKVSFTPEQE